MINSCVVYLLDTSPLQGCKVLRSACLFVCLFVCSLAYLKNHVSKFYQIFYTY